MMSYTAAWIASLIGIYAVLGIAPLVLGTWVMVQRTSALLSGLWLVLLFCMLLGTLAIGVFGLYALTSTPNGPILGG